MANDEQPETVALTPLVLLKAIYPVWEVVGVESLVIGGLYSWLIGEQIIASIIIFGLIGVLVSTLTGVLDIRLGLTNGLNIIQLGSSAKLPMLGEEYKGSGWNLSMLLVMLLFFAIIAGVVGIFLFREQLTEWYWSTSWALERICVRDNTC